jgi:D-alanine transaminase
VLLKHESNQGGFDDAVLFRDGYLTESSASNIAAVKNGVILCPPMDNLILPGITYELMIELARKHNMPLEIGRVSRRQVKAADELWIMSSTKEVAPIVMLDGKPIGSGQPGPVFKKMYQHFQEFKRALAEVASAAA